jgi:hypothetical protein
MESVDVFNDRIDLLFNGTLSSDNDGIITNCTWNLNGEMLYGEQVTVGIERYGFLDVVLETTDDNGLKDRQGSVYLIIPENERYTLNLTDLIPEEETKGLYDVIWKMEDSTRWEGNEVEISTGNEGISEIDVFYMVNDWEQKKIEVKVFTVDSELLNPQHKNTEGDRPYLVPILPGVGGTVAILVLIIVFGIILILKKKILN